MKRSMTAAFVLCAFLAFPAAPASAAEGGEARTLVEALKNGDVGLELRYRWERVEDDTVLDPNTGATLETATASTIRTYLSYGTLPFYGFSAFVAFEDVSNLGYANDHNSTRNGVIDHAAVVDPPGTDFEEGYLRYSLPEVVDVQAGRMHLIYGQQRFIGPVPWRQNYQSFDAATLSIRAIPRTTLRLTYIDNVLRIFDDNKEMSSPLADATMKIGSSGTLTAYYYKLDYDEAADAGLSTSTAGLRWQNTWDLPGAWSIPYHAEFARQKDTGENPNDVEADYWRVELAGKRKSLKVAAGYELLGGSADDGAFATPLATLHKWNGWADKFLRTPPNGLADLYLSAGYGWRGWTGSVIWHQFKSDSEDMDYGSEIDAIIQWKSSWGQTFTGKAAFYDADELFFDKEVYWLYTSWKI